MIIILVCLFLIALTYAWWKAYEPAKILLVISSFEECKRAGYPIMESFPEQCRTPDGRVFISPQELNQLAQ